jgi:hypothetical protein
MDRLIISQGSMLASGATRMAIPGTPAGSRPSGTRSNGVGRPSSMMVTAAGSPSSMHIPDFLTRDIRRGHTALIQANQPGKWRAPTMQGKRPDTSPSTFQQMALGGHLPMSWLMSGGRS